MSVFKNLPAAPVATKKPVSDTRHGITRAAVSKRCVDITERLKLPHPGRCVARRPARVRLGDEVDPPTVAGFVAAQDAVDLDQCILGPHNETNFQRRFSHWRVSSAEHTTTP